MWQMLTVPAKLRLCLAWAWCEMDCCLITGLAACPTEDLRVLKGFRGTCLLLASCRAPTLLMLPAYNA